MCRIENPGNCIKQSALIAVNNVKFRSNPILTGQFTVDIVGQKEGRLRPRYSVSSRAHLGKFERFK